MMAATFESKPTDRPGSQRRRMQDFALIFLCAVVAGIFAGSAEPGYLDLISPNAGDSYYNLLVQGFRNGQLNVNREPSPALATLPNPYDPGANRPYVWDAQYLAQDMSYYHGKLYLYFGVTPAITLFWPYLILTGHYLPARDAVVIFFTVGFLLAAALLRALWRRYFPEASFGIMACGIMIMGLGTGILGQLSSCDLYEIAVSCGFAFIMLALTGVWGALHDSKRKIIWLLLASLAYGLAVGSRPSLLFGAIILLAPVVQTWCTATEPRERGRVVWLLLAAVVPITLIGLGLMVYNARRFDNPFEFGWKYQLAGDVDHTVARQFSLHYLWINFRFYFLEPMGWTSSFPFLKPLPISPVPAGYGGIGLPYSGVLTDYPIVWLALAAPLAWKGTKVKNFSPLQWLVTALFFLCGICAATICSFIMASSRYQFDFLPALMLLAVIGIFGWERSLAGSTTRRRWLTRATWGGLLGYSILFNILSSIEAHAQSNCLTGNSFLSLGRLEEAMVQYQKALTLWPECAEARGGVANIFFQKGQIDEAIAQYQKALQSNPGFAEMHNNLGFCYLQKDRLDDAIAQYQSAVELRPDSANFHNVLANAFFQKGQVPEAISEYQKALEIETDFPEAHYNLGYCYAQAGRLEEAIAQYQSALGQRPGSATYHNALGNAFFQKGQIDDAIRQYEATVEIEPGFAETMYNLGFCLAQKGEARDAIAAYRKAMVLHPEFIPAQTSLAWLLATWPDATMRNGSEGIALAEKANELSGNKDPRTLRTLAAAYAEGGRFPEAITTAKQALGLAPAQSKLGNELRDEIELYQKNSPLRTTAN
jgi:tetratricopeptide (TPR) repeat protein